MKNSLQKVSLVQDGQYSNDIMQSLTQHESPYATFERNWNPL